MSIVLDTIFLRMLCERVIVPQELTRFSQTKCWPKLKVVTFGRFGLSNGVNIHQFIFESSTQKYPAGLSGFSSKTLASMYGNK